MKQKPLISIIVLSYKNYRYIYEALGSVLYQDYPNIELIITNDGSDDFNKIAVDQYLKKNKKQNIKNVVINNNEKNIGTVKNCNKAIKLSKGDYITIFAADDALYNNKVITKLIDSFDTLSEKELIVTSQTNMCDVNLKKLIQPFISEINKEKIKKLTPKELFAEMTTKCILPGSGTCYKKEIFKKYGYFDERYLLVEDYSSALKLSRLGVRYNYFDFVSIKHRDGGISHGNINGASQTSKQYDLDILNIMKNEVLPFTDLLDTKQKKEALKKYQNNKFKFEYKYNFENGTKLQKRQFVKKNINTIILNFFGDFISDSFDQLKGKKIKLFLFGILIFTFYCFYNDYIKGLEAILSTPISIDLVKIIGMFGLFLILFSILLLISNFIKKFLFRIFKFVKFIL